MPDDRHDYLADCEHPPTSSAASRADPLSDHTHLQQVATVNWLTGEVG